MFSIIIVDWKTPELTQHCINNIKNNSYYNDHEIILFRNEYDYEGGIKGYHCLCRDKKNIGLSKARNKAARSAIKPYLCFIDSDVYVLKNWDMELYKAMLLTGSKWVCSTYIEPIPSNTNVSFKKHRYSPENHGWYTQISNTPLLIPKDFYRKIGGHDEDFPNVGAELGLAKRAFDHGCKDFVQTPYSYVIHEQSQSMKKLPGKPALRQQRDKIFKRKYGITREEFIKQIGKGERYNPND